MFPTDYKFIVFCEDHYNPLGVVRSLGEKNIKPIVILITNNGKPILLNHSRYVSVLHEVKTVEEGYKLLLENYSCETHEPFIYTCNDKTTEFLDKHYDELNGKFIFFNGKKTGAITHYMDKDNISKLAEECGCHIPYGEVLQKGELPQKTKYPVITKTIMSTVGGWKNDVHICRNETELKNAYTNIQAQTLLVEEYIEKKNELCLDGFSINEGKDICIPYFTNYIRFYKNSYGHYMTLAPFKDQSVLNQVKEILKKAKFEGIFSVEFLIDKNNDLHFLEVNFRNSTWSYAFTYGGCNMPYLWAKSTLAGRILFEEMQLRDEPFRAIVEPSDFVRNVKKVGFITWFKQCFSAECHYYYNKKDPKPFYSYVWNRLFGKHKVSEF